MDDKAQNKINFFNKVLAFRKILYLCTIIPSKNIFFDFLLLNQISFVNQKSLKLQFTFFAIAFLRVNYAQLNSMPVKFLIFI